MLAACLDPADALSHPDHFVLWANRAQHAVRLHTKMSSTRPRLEILTRECARPFFCTGNTVCISAWDSDRLAKDARLKRDEYLLVLGLIGLTEWQALALNPALQREDLLFHCDPLCLFAQRLYIEQWTLPLLHGFVCGGCRHFYQTLGAGRLLDGIDAVFACCAKPRLCPAEARAARNE